MECPEKERLRVSHNEERQTYMEAPYQRVSDEDDDVYPDWKKLTSAKYCTVWQRDPLFDRVEVINVVCLCVYIGAGLPSCQNFKLTFPRPTQGQPNLGT